jgi:hypothetical protein
MMTAVEPVADAPDLFVAVGGGARRPRYRRCGNDLDHGACNWMVPEGEGATQRFCRACRLNEVIPNLSDPEAKQAWMKLEQAKRRLIYTLLDLRLPVEPRADSPRGMAFAMKKDEPGGEKVMIGHEAGLITINIAEADSPFREKVRLGLGETYRTLLGHFRHEIGHYYWERLIADSAFLNGFRELFGDERASYEEAVQRHYNGGPPADWANRFVSSYASMHPWEDWAESWAHYLHMVDTLETARSFGLALRPTVARGVAAAKQAVKKATAELEVGTRELAFDDFDDLARAWPPLTVALNGLNRSMGTPDMYPFVLSEPALKKIRFVHDTVEQVHRDLRKAA